jgi:hypothetical protein
LLFCAWLAWSRFRVVIPVWDRTLPTVLSCLDETFRRVEGIPTYVLTDNEKTVTAEHIAGVPVRHPDMAAAGRHYGTTDHQLCAGRSGVQGRLGSDREDRQGRPGAHRREPARRLPQLRGAAGRDGVWCEHVNARPHRETGRAPVDMLAEEQRRLHPVPADPYVAALGERRVVTRAR